MWWIHAQVGGLCTIVDMVFPIWGSVFVPLRE